MTEKTEIVFLDDVRANLDFEFFFPLITGKLTVNQKGNKKFTLSSEKTPKLIISTNHAINGEGASFKDRQFCIAFSDFYNEKHKPTDDFNTTFFDEWEYDQWNLFYNFMARCLQAFLKYGFINPPDERLEKRRRRQLMGEEFLAWAEEYYSPVDKSDQDYDTLEEAMESSNLNIKITRKELHSNFCECFPRVRKWLTPPMFKNKMKSYCKYKGLIFNPSGENFIYDGRDIKSGGKEYFIVGTPRHFE